MYIAPLSMSVFCRSERRFCRATLHKPTCRLWRAHFASVCTYSLIINNDYIQRCSSATGVVSGIKAPASLLIYGIVVKHHLFRVKGSSGSKAGEVLTPGLLLRLLSCVPGLPNRCPPGTSCTVRTPAARGLGCEKWGLLVCSLSCSLSHSNFNTVAVTN